jgi:hypothetical protein
MKDLTDEFKLSVRSTPEVFEALGAMVHRLRAGRKLKFRDKKPTRAAVVNASLLYLFSLPPEEWERALGVGLSRLEAALQSEETAAPAPEPTKALVPKRVRRKVEDVSPPPKTKPTAQRKRGG